MPLLSSVDHVDDSGAGEMAPSVWIRNRRRTRTWAAFAALWSVVFVWLLLAPSDPGRHRSLSEFLVIAVLYLGIAGVGLALARRVARSGIWIGPEGIVVRGPFRSQSVSLDDAISFAPGLQGRGGNGTPCPILSLRAGRAVGVWALGQRNIWFRYGRLCDEIQPVCDELNRLVATVHRGQLPG